MPKQPSTFFVEQIIHELGNITGTLGELNKAGPRGIFKKLESIAVSSIYARGIDNWGQMENWAETDPAPTRNGLHPMVNILNGSPREYMAFLSQLPILRTHCSRQGRGPLCPGRLDSSHFTESHKASYLRTYRFPSVAPYVPLPHGGLVRYSSDIPHSHDFSAVLNHILLGIENHMDQRRDIRRRYKCLPQWLDLEVYASTSESSDDDMLSVGGIKTTSLTREQQMYIASQTGSQMERQFKAKSGGSDKFRWLPSFLTPICEACGSGVPV